ncbi:PTS sugar transporter subunit IIA [Clostridium polynesiense]|uniref:PTS sugar transporter subunit IIA n=1 Tax=Clostridium polynesiense TaxID=1325933 RepID=UPI00058B6A7D|nr:PTS sugar transporter subunit IIA [Clostridium polynesiense]
MGLLNKDLIVLEADVSSAEECIRLAADLFEKYGYVKEGYGDAVVEREKIYPTGLPGKGINIAIPHTNNKLVNKPGIAVILPKNSVGFTMMGTDDKVLDCEIIIPLVIYDSHMQIEVLKKMTKIIKDGEVLKKIRDSKSKKEILNCLCSLEEN